MRHAAVGTVSVLKGSPALERAAALVAICALLASSPSAQSAAPTTPEIRTKVERAFHSRVEATAFAEWYSDQRFEAESEGRIDVDSLGALPA